MNTTRSDRHQSKRKNLFQSYPIYIFLAVVLIAGLLYAFLPRHYAGYTISASQYRQISKLKKDITIIDDARNNPDDLSKIDKAKKAIQRQQKYAGKTNSKSLSDEINHSANSLLTTIGKDKHNLSFSTLITMRTSEILGLPVDKVLTAGQEKQFQKVVHQIYHDTGQE